MKIIEGVCIIKEKKNIGEVICNVMPKLSNQHHNKNEEAKYYKQTCVIFSL